MASYNIFNYNHRPAKSIERKVFVELLKEIYGVTDAPNCTYIGFGSIFFIDFKMIHKELGIKSMINIEDNEEDQKRFIFNKPFSCIKLKWGKSTDVLTDQIDWRGKKIIWLDYDETLQPYMFEDLDIIFSNVEPGSFYFFTSNGSLPKYFNKATQSYEVVEFQEEFEGYVPFGLTPQMLTINEVPYLIRSMIALRINHILEQRNALLDDQDQLVYCQLLLIKYKDNAPMFSTGGIILKRKEIPLLRRNGILNLPYVRTNNAVLNIQSPVLTNAEIDLINSHLPKSKKRFLNLKKLKFIPEEEKEMYHGIYRYYPSYVEVRDF